MAGILTWKGYFRRCWCPSLSTYPPQCLPRGRHDTYVSQAAKDVQKSQDTLIDIFERVEGFFRRLEIYAAVQPTTEMMDTIIQIMVEILSILGIATKEIKESRLSE
jgi:hypothetical protein